MKWKAASLKISIKLIKHYSDWQRKTERKHHVPTLGIKGDITADSTDIEMIIRNTMNNSRHINPET